MTANTTLSLNKSTIIKDSLLDWLTSMNGACFSKAWQILQSCSCIVNRIIQEVNKLWPIYETVDCPENVSEELH